MADEGRSLPRPPRRVPPAAGTLTQLQTTRPRAPQPPPRQPWIFGRVLAGFVVLLLVVAGGATAGWFVRAQSLRIDTKEVLAKSGPAVVRVLATTCGGSGTATGVLTEGGRVLTATSAVRQPKSVVVVTPSGQIHRANVIGTSADGVAVLQPLGAPVDATPVPVAAAAPDAKAERALIGYTATGRQTIQPIGSIAEPRPLSTVMNAEKLGGPVVDKAGQLVGLVVGDTVEASTIVGRDNLRGYVGATPAGLTPEPGGECLMSRGPATPVVPELQVGGTPLAKEAQKLLGTYLTLENKHDFAALQALYSERLAASLTVERDKQGHQTSYFFGAQLTEVSPYGGDGAYARMTYNVLFSPNANGAGGRTCNRLDVRYRLIREGGKLVVDEARSMSDPVPCDSQ